MLCPLDGKGVLRSRVRILRRILRLAEKTKACIAASLGSIWCRHQESNPGPTDYKSVALPAELYRQLRVAIISIARGE